MRKNLNQVIQDLKDKSADNPGLISFPHSIGSAVVKPEDKGKN